MRMGKENLKIQLQYQISHDLPGTQLSPPRWEHNATKIVADAIRVILHVFTHVVVTQCNKSFNLLDSNLLSNIRIFFLFRGTCHFGIDYSWCGTLCFYWLLDVLISALQVFRHTPSFYCTITMFLNVIRHHVFSFERTAFRRQDSVSGMVCKEMFPVLPNRRMFTVPRFLLEHGSVDWHAVYISSTLELFRCFCKRGNLNGYWNFYFHFKQATVRVLHSAANVFFVSQ